MAWWVVLGHVSLAFGWGLPLVDDNGLAVDVFILLSGFVIARLIDRKDEAYGAYIARRAFRLLPLYLPVLLLSALLLPIQLEAWRSLAAPTPSDLNRIALAEAAIGHLRAHLGAHLLLAQGLVPQGLLPWAAFTILGQAWSISLEWQFYLVAPLLVWSLVDRRRWPLALLAVAALALSARYFPDAYLGARILQFGVGVCSYLAIARPDQRRTWLVVTGALGLLTLVRHGAMELVPLAIWAAVLASATALPHQRRHWLASGLGSRLAVHFGEMSYSVYLLHMIPLYGSIWLLSRAGITGPVLGVEVAALTVGGTYLLGRLSFRWIEQTGVAWGARLTSARPAKLALAA
jgi:peptidoglycan/LPS O-acetylase OafA/YrhL